MVVVEMGPFFAPLMALSRQPSVSPMTIAQICLRSVSNDGTADDNLQRP